MTKFLTFLLLTISFVPAFAQQYQPVSDKSTVKFSIKNFGINTGGDFKGLQGEIEFDKANPEKSSFSVSIDANTVNTDNDSRDNHLRKEEYFDVQKFPKIEFKSEKISAKGSDFVASGKLTIKGTTKSVSIPFKAEAKDDGYLFEGSFQLNRKDYKVGGNSVVLGDNVTVTLSVFARKK
ncbi:MAG: YceI family protein [Chitinophagaceae bacterium]